MKQDQNVFYSIILAAVLALTTTTVSASAAPSDAVDRNVDLVVPIEALNKVSIEKGRGLVSASEVPTVSEVNAALKNLEVGKGQQKEIDLGNGHTINISAGNQSFGDSVRTAEYYPNFVQNQTASGTISYVFYGVQMFSLSESVNYTYDNMTAEILFHDDLPSVAAPGWVGWSTSIDSRFIRNLDSKVKDAVCDVTWTATGAVMKRYGHMELRFTGAGNYYVHDSYIR